MSLIAQRLKELRASKKLSQKALSDNLNIGLRNYQRYEYGDSEPNIKIAIALADFFDVSLDDLVGREFPKK